MHFYASSLLPSLGGSMKAFFMTPLLLSDGRFANEQDLAVSCRVPQVKPFGLVSNVSPY